MRSALPIVLGLALLAACAAEVQPPPSAPVPPAPTVSPPPVAPAASAAPPSDDAAIQAACQAYIDLVVRISPEAATQLGLHTRDAELDDRSLEGFERDTVLEEQMLASLRERFATPHASPTSLTDLAIVVHRLAVDARLRREIPPLLRPDTYASPMEALFLMTARDYAPAEERAKNALARIEKIPAQLEEAKKNLQRPPKVWTQIGIEAASGARAFFEEERKPLSDALPSEKARVEAALTRVEKAYADYQTFLEKVVLPRSDGTYAAGSPLFDFLLKQDFFVTEGASDLLALAQTVLAETDAQMAAVAKRIDPKAKGWPDVLRASKSHHPSAAGLLPTYRTQMARARQFLVDKDVVTLPAGDDCEVAPTPTFMRSVIGAAYDEPPAFDAVTKGFFFVTPVDLSLPKARQEQVLRDNDFAGMADTVVHETYPGHHLQLSLARRHPSVIRKVTGPPIFAEGWGLYAEELMSELGMYTDEERLGQLQWTLVRAARIVIDVGLHTQGMTFEQAVAILTDRAHLERESALTEVRRYTESPTQPSSYLLGKQKLLALRERAKREWGAGYSLKRFHDEVLSHGTIAPGLLEHEMFP